MVIVTCRNLTRNALRYGTRGRDFYSLIDASCASMMLLLAARNEGLGACFVGAYRDREVSRILGLPRHVQPVGIIPIGRPADSPPALSRLPLSEVVHQEAFGGTISR